MNSDDFINEMNAYYDSRAEWHDDYMSYESNAKMEEQLEPIISLIEKYIVNKDVLEIACGTGNWTQVLARRAKSVLATDINQSVIDIALGKEYKSTKPEFVIADAYTLDNIGTTHDVTFAADFFSHIPIPKVGLFIRSAANRLRSGGTIIVLDMLPHEGLEIDKHQYDDDGNFYCLRTLPNGERFRVIKNFPDQVQLSDYFACLGGNLKYYQNDALKRWLVIFTLS